MKRKEVCKNCKFYDEAMKAYKFPSGETQSGSGYCRVNAPERHERDGSGVWPYVDENDWCGKFQQK